MLSVMHECSHTHVHTHPFMYSAEFALFALEMWTQTGFRSNYLSFLLQGILVLIFSNILLIFSCTIFKCVFFLLVYLI